MNSCRQCRAGLCCGARARGNAKILPLVCGHLRRRSGLFGLWAIPRGRQRRLLLEGVMFLTLSIGGLLREELLVGVRSRAGQGAAFGSKRVKSAGRSGRRKLPRPLSVRSLDVILGEAFVLDPYALVPAEGCLCFLLADRRGIGRISNLVGKISFRLNAQAVSRLKLRNMQGVS